MSTCSNTKLVENHNIILSDIRNVTPKRYNFSEVIFLAFLLNFKTCNVKTLKLNTFAHVLESTKLYDLRFLVASHFRQFGPYVLTVSVEEGVYSTNVRCDLNAAIEVAMP